ncbi:hypothetical protein [Gordonia sp. UBA7599]|uniref:hypothetical protein n=2 Tax=Gordonia TaxID=2053 RepID=UPI0025C36AE4|nr:hypothetical protein [Gordonia sp. UBA7599]HNP55621.1 hypothetical protein [Gordonia sp. (in: high G+C Gram-positive bacteria)]
MSSIVYFLISAVALAGAGVLLWLDHQRSTVARAGREVWGDAKGFHYRASDSKLRRVFRRATMDVPDHVDVRDVAFGDYDGAEAVVFDLTETATVIAVRRKAASQVIIDLRHEDVLAPAETDVELLGAMGPRVVFSNNLDVARRVCDRRMIALANAAPPFIEVLWTEGKWALGSMPLTNDPARLDAALDVVRRFADLLRVLPPSVDPQDAPDPRDPHGPHIAELADEKTENMRDKRRREADRVLAEEPTTVNPLPPLGTNPADYDPFNTDAPAPPARGAYPGRPPAPQQQGQPASPPAERQRAWQRPPAPHSPLYPGDDER